jgi:hypothetical protein
MLEAGLEVVTEHWSEWPYGERRVSLMLADVFRAMRACEVRENLGSNVMSDESTSSRDRFDLIDREILASQIVAIMNAHWRCPDAAQKKEILRRAERQIDDGFRVGPPEGQTACETAEA